MNTDTHTTDDMAASPSRFYTLKEAAAILNVNPSTLSRQCQAGTFPHVRIGRTVRIPVAEVERLERGERMRESVLDVPDYVTGTASMFDSIPEADSPEDDADMRERGLRSTSPAPVHAVTPRADAAPSAPVCVSTTGRRST